METKEGLVVRGRVEIDMRRPFKSVKEAVMLFGEKVLAGEVYAGPKLKQTERVEGENNHQYLSKVGAIAAELEETKQSLEKAKDEDTCMAYYLSSLKQLKSRKEPYYPKQCSPVDKEIEDIKFIENPIRVEVNHSEIQESDDENDEYFWFEKKRSMKFASPPALTKVMVEAPINMQETSPSSLKKKALRKTLIPSHWWDFLKKERRSISKKTKIIEIKDIGYVG